MQKFLKQILETITAITIGIAFAAFFFLWLSN